MPGMMMQDDPTQQPPDPAMQGDPSQQPGDPSQGQPPMMGQPQDDAGGAPDQEPDQLDTADTANQPQQGDPDADTFTQMVAGLRNYIYGKGEQGLVTALQRDQGDGRVLGEVTFSLVHEAAKQADKAGRELGMDILLGVATEVIDDLAELMDAHGVSFDDKAKHFALLYAQQLYVENAKPSNDERSAAKQALGQMRDDGSVDTAVSYVQQRGAEAGADPFGVSQMGKRPQMMQGKDDGAP